MKWDQLPWRQKSFMQGRMKSLHPLFHSKLPICLRKWNLLWSNIQQAQNWSLTHRYEKFSEFRFIFELETRQENLLKIQTARHKQVLKWLNLKSVDQSHNLKIWFFIWNAKANWDLYAQLIFLKIQLSKTNVLRIFQHNPAWKPRTPENWWVNYKLVSRIAFSRFQITQRWLGWLQSADLDLNLRKPDYLDPKIQSLRKTQFVHSRRQKKP